MKIENRIYGSSDLQLRAYSDGDKKIIEGYAATYSTESRLLYENGKKFIEVIERGAFDNVVNNDVYLTFNHSKDTILARTINKTLELRSDEKGLFFRAELNDTTASNDVYKMVERGDVVENSFAFTVDEGQKWERSTEGVPLRRISRISNLFDVSVVTKAAYPQTSVWARGFEEFENEQKPIEIIHEGLKMREHIKQILKIK